MEIRNFCIIAHIDSGKSTLADRFLELTQSVSSRKMRPQFLDMMDLEREKGITIKMQPVRMKYNNYILNLIDTPGHVDFSYEVSRSLAAVEGAILLVDVTKGIQAQTLANLELAQKQNLVIIPVVNKIDLIYDSYKGVVAYIRVVDGEINKTDRIRLLAGKTQSDIKDLGYFIPEFLPQAMLECGEIGYIATGIKEPGRVRVGDTIIKISNFQFPISNIEPLPGYKEPEPMVFASLYPESPDDFDLLKDGLSKLKLSDPSLVFELETKESLGRGFRCGFLGTLHAEVVSERLHRDLKVNLIISSPSVVYKVDAKFIYSASDWPHSPKETEEPWGVLEVIIPT